MAKKYLLYIHNPGFEKEPHKSALVNELLGRYYGDDIVEVPSTAHEVPKKTTLKKSPKKTGYVDSKGRPACKHGYALFITCNQCEREAQTP